MMISKSTIAAAALLASSVYGNSALARPDQSGPDMPDFVGQMCQDVPYVAQKNCMYEEKMAFQYLSAVWHNTLLEIRYACLSQEERIDKRRAKPNPFPYSIISDCVSQLTNMEQRMQPEQFHMALSIYMQ